MTSEEAREMLTKKTKHRFYALEFLLLEQRKICAENLKKKSPAGVIPQWMVDACLDATEESDENV